MPYKILVVDDEPDLELLVRQNFRRKIRANELSFVFAHNGKLALQKLEEESDIDVMMSDINMPEMDGLTLLDAVIDKYPLLRSVIVSAYGDMKNLRTAMNNGAFDFVTKPIDFEDLEKTLMKTVTEVQSLRESQKVKEQLLTVKRELEIGRTIQKSFLPTTIPIVEGWDFAAHFQPAKECAGDFYDIFPVSNNRGMCFVLGDVCGKGVGSALFMTLVRSLLHAYAAINDDLHDMVYKTVQMAHDYITTIHEDANMFATLFFGVLDVETGELTYINGGHCSPMQVSPSGEVHELEPTGPVVGMFPSNDFKIARTTMQKGDLLFIYSDGATDCINEAQELYGEERLFQFVKDNASQSAAGLLDTLMKTLTSHMNGFDQFDDITLTAIKR